MSVDHRVLLRCPYCNARAVYGGKQGVTAFYDCRTCGGLALPPGDRLRRLTDEEQDARDLERITDLFRDGPDGKPRPMN